MSKIYTNPINIKDLSTCDVATINLQENSHNATYMCKMKLFIAVLLLMLIAACKSTDEHPIVYIEGYDNPIKPNSDDIQIDSFFVVGLEQCENSIVSNIKKIDFIDSLMLVHSDRKLLAFHHQTGKYIRTYGERGNGANEYVELTTFFVDKSHGHIFLVDGYRQRVLKFDAVGHFIDCENYPENVLALLHKAELIDVKMIFSSNYVYNDKNSIYSVIDTHKKSSKSIFNFGARTENIAMPIGSHPYVYFNDTIRCIVPFNDTIFTFQGNDKLIPDFVVRSSKRKMTISKISDVNNFSINTYIPLINNDEFLGFTDVFESSTKIFLGFYNQYYFLIDKSSGVGQRYDYSFQNEPSNLPIVNIKSIHNDFFVGVVNPYEFVSWEFTPNTTNKSINLLRQAIEEIDLHHNPIILFYYLR